MKRFDLISDPGHGWARIPLTLLGDLGILGEISAFSYFRGLNAYLEEDRDLSIFITAFRARFGCDPSFRDRVARCRHSRIRNYSSFVLADILASLTTV